MPERLAGRDPIDRRRWIRPLRRLALWLRGSREEPWEPVGLPVPVPAASLSRVDAIFCNAFYWLILNSNSNISTKDALDGRREGQTWEVVRQQQG